MSAGAVQEHAIMDPFRAMILVVLRFLANAPYKNYSHHLVQKGYYKIVLIPQINFSFLNFTIQFFLTKTK